MYRLQSTHYSFIKIDNQFTKKKKIQKYVCFIKKAGTGAATIVKGFGKRMHRLRDGRTTKLSFKYYILYVSKHETLKPEIIYTLH